MKCEEYLERMSAYLDGIPSEELEAHLAACPSCRRELEALRQSNEALQGFPSLSWKSEMTEAILARTHRNRAARWIPAAAGILVAIATTLSLSRTSERAPVSIATSPSSDEELARHVAAVRLLAKQADDPPPDPAVAQAQIETLGLIDRTRRLRNADVPLPVKNYLEQSWTLLNNAGTNTVSQTYSDFSILFNTARSWQFSNFTEASWINYNGTFSDDVNLYAVGRLEAAGGNVTGANSYYLQLVDHYPESRYASLVLPTLGSTAVQAGDSVGALAYYSSITEPTAITATVANEIKTVSSRVGEVYVGGDSVQELDLEELRVRAAARTPYVVVRTTPDQVREVLLLGYRIDTRNRSGNLRGIRRTIRCGAVIDPKELPELERELQVKLRLVER